MSKVYTIAGVRVLQNPGGNCATCAFRNGVGCAYAEQKQSGSEPCYSGLGHNYIPAPVEYRPVSGHHPVHLGLQNHSVGGAYPLCVVGYGNGGLGRKRVEAGERRANFAP